MLTTDGAKSLNDKRWNSPESLNARAEKHIAALVALAPPLSQTQRARLSALLTPAHKNKNEEKKP